VVLLALGHGDLAFDGKGDTIRAWHTEGCCITADLDLVSLATLPDFGIEANVPCESGMSTAYLESAC
jgi:hypothetical protein